jgi:hypothetical protein
MVTLLVRRRIRAYHNAKTKRQATAGLLIICLLLGCTGVTPPEASHKINSNAVIQKISEPFDLRERPCRLSFVYTIRYEESDNAIATGPKKSLRNGYRRVIQGRLESRSSGADMAWQLEVTRMEINGNPVSHQQAALTMGQFMTGQGGIKKAWQIRLPAYEDTGASRFFSTERLAALKADTRALAEDLVPYRFKRAVKTGDKLLRLNLNALPVFLDQTGLDSSAGREVTNVDHLVLMTDGWRQYRGRRVLKASARQRLDFDTRKTGQHHRLVVEAIYLLDGRTSCPVAGYINLDLQTRYLSYTRRTRLIKEMNYQLQN